MEIEVPGFDACAPDFLEWAGQAANVRLPLGPDPILAVDEPGRRGYILDDVYSAVAWIAEGGGTNWCGLFTTVASQRKPRHPRPPTRASSWPW